GGGFGDGDREDVANRIEPITAYREVGKRLYPGNESLRGVAGVRAAGGIPQRNGHEPAPIRTTPNRREGADGSGLIHLKRYIDRPIPEVVVVIAQLRIVE